MIEPSWLLCGLVLPAVVAFICLMALFRAGKSASTLRGGRALVISLGLGFISGYIASMGPPPWPPTVDEHWLVYLLVPAAVIVTVFNQSAKVPTSLKWIGRAMLAGLTPALLLMPVIRREWNPLEAALYLAAIALLILCLDVSLHLLATRRPVRSLLAVLFIVASATGMVVFLSDSARTGQISLTLAAAIAGALLATLLLRRAISVAAAGHLSVIVLSAIWINFWFYVQVTPTPIEAIKLALLIPALPAAWLVEWPVLARLTARWRETARITIVLVPVLAALIVAMIHFVSESRQSATGYY